MKHKKERVNAYNRFTYYDYMVHRNEHAQNERKHLLVDEYIFLFLS